MSRGTAAGPIAAVTLALLGLAACPAEDEGPSEPLSLVTFNVGLAFGYVEDASGRIDPAIDAVNNSGADVVCIQELWTNQDENAEWSQETIDRFLSGTMETYRYQHWERTVAPEDAAPTGCNIEESEPLEVCAFAACGDVPTENITDCVLANCTPEFSETSAGCQSCLAANLGMPLEDIVAACKGVTTSGIVYDGHNGLLVLSKHKFEVEEIIEFDFALTARAALHVRVGSEDVEPFDVYCTHLASNLSSSISYPEGGTYTSFAEENAAQTDALLQWVEQTSTTETVVLLGDFNHGTGELPDSYAKVIDAEFADPIADGDAPCSFCGSNTLLAGATDVDELIDHAYVKTDGQIEEATIVFDSPVSITKADGTVAESNISDHFGVRLDLLR